jgi:hypothetical protein
MRILVLVLLGLLVILASGVSAQVSANSLWGNDVLTENDNATRQVLEAGLIFTNVGLSTASLMTRDGGHRTRTTIGILSTVAGLTSLGLSFSEDAEYPALVFLSGVVSIGTGMVVLLAPKSRPLGVSLGESIRLDPWLTPWWIGLRMNGRF